MIVMDDILDVKTTLEAGLAFCVAVTTFTLVVHIDHVNIIMITLTPRYIHRTPSLILDFYYLSQDA